MNKYLYCKVLLAGHTTALWYIADFEAKVGDFVKVSIRTDDNIELGYITETFECTEENAPFEIARTKHIIEKCEDFKDLESVKSEIENQVRVKEEKKILREKKAAERKAEKERIQRLSLEKKERDKERFWKSVKTEIFKPSILPREKISKDKYSAATGVVFRGLDEEIDKAMKYIDQDGERKQASPGISEIRIVYYDIEKFIYVVENFPGLKVVAFLEDYRVGRVEVCYSESGYSFVECYPVGYTDYHIDIRWTCTHYASEEKFSGREVHISTGEYTRYSYKFLFKEDWEKINYVFEKNGVLHKIVGMNNLSLPEFTVDDRGKGKAVIVAYNGNDTDVTFPSEVEGLKITGVELRGRSTTQNAIYNKIKSVTISEGCEYVGGFENFSNLKCVTLPKSLAIVEKKAFMECKKLEKVNMSDNTFYIKDKAFSGCKSLEEFHLPVRLRGGENDAFDRKQLGKEIFASSGIKKLYVKNTFISPEKSNLLKGCKDCVIYAPEGSEFFKDTTYRGATRVYNPGPLSLLYNHLAENGIYIEFEHAEIDEEEMKIKNAIAFIDLTDFGVEQQWQNLNAKIEGEYINVYNNTDNIGTIRLAEEAGEIIERYNGKVKNLRLVNNSKRYLREYYETLLDFDVEFDKEYVISIMQENLEVESPDPVKLVFNETDEKFVSEITAKGIEQISGKIFVVTGKLDIFANRNEIKEMLENNGARLSETLNSLTDYLITNDPFSGSKKNLKAKELGVKVISEDDFVKMIAQK